MASPLFPTGQWVGFYTYGGGSDRFMMDLALEFFNGKMGGEGADGIGLFVIDGRYSEKDRECFWDKTYVGAHTVKYHGFREGKGIWGTWTLEGCKGGFHIWPLTEGKPMDPLKDEVEVEHFVPAKAGPKRL
jgi:hypothetical protein